MAGLPQEGLGWSHILAREEIMPQELAHCFCGGKCLRPGLSGAASILTMEMGGKVTAWPIHMAASTVPPTLHCSDILTSSVFLRFNTFH